MRTTPLDKIMHTAKQYPRFADGRIDYTHARVCFAVNCVAVCGDKVLLTKRGSDVIAYPDTISGVSGFIDRTDISIEDQAKLELTEEVQAPLDKITSLKVSHPIVRVDTTLNREWHIYAVYVEFSELFEPKINWENKAAQWHTISDVKNMELMPGFLELFETALHLR